MSKVIVVGGGAAGMMGAIWAARAGHSVTLYEQNEKLGKKLFITGKGRCNLTNDSDAETLYSNVISNPKFLYSAFSEFDATMVMQFFEQLGLRLKTERGNRVFPLSDHSSDVIKALEYEMRRLGVQVVLNTKVKSLIVSELPKTTMDMETTKKIDDNTSNPQSDSANAKVVLKEYKKKSAKQEKALQKCEGILLANGKKETADFVLLATGGISYPLTGASGDGLEAAKTVGHKVTELLPALVPLKVEEQWAHKLMGLSLRNVNVTIKKEKKILYEGFGEMLFTHYGVSGPIILSASSQIVKQLQKGNLQLFLDLKPALTAEQLDKRLLRDFEAGKNKQLRNALGDLLPARLIEVVIALSEVSPEKKVNEITKAERLSILNTLKNMPLTITGTGGFNEAIITQGGISVKEINPATMESKLVKNLFFAGECMDVDALTGGFNLQIAWSTAYLAGTHMQG